MIAFVARLSGLRHVTERCGYFLNTANFSSLSHALRRVSSLTFVRRLVAIVESTHEPVAGELVAVDGMALSLPATQRHNMKKMNNKTVGGGVVWMWMIESASGMSPVKLLKTIRGAWHDTTVARETQLASNGPIYLMDRGFYALDLVERWITDTVHFIVRARERCLHHEVLRHLSAARAIGKKKKLLLDAVARLGAASAKARPTVRLVIAQLASGEKLILVTDLMDRTAEEILAAYAKRWHVERFHNFLKDALGLAHLYSFDQTGAEFLLLTALLTAMLLVLSDDAPAGETIVIARRALRVLRSLLGLAKPWRRNCCTRGRQKKTAREKAQTLKR